VECSSPEDNSEPTATKGTHLATTQHDDCLAPQQGHSIRRSVLEKILKFKVNNRASVLAIPAGFTSHLVIRDLINSGGRISWFTCTRDISIIRNQLCWTLCVPLKSLVTRNLDLKKTDVMMV